jgi:hypothetical protein
MGTRQCASAVELRLWIMQKNTEQRNARAQAAPGGQCARKQHDIPFAIACGTRLSSVLLPIWVGTAST